MRKLPAPVLPEPIQVREIRRRMNISRRQFAILFRIPVATVRHWENGERQPRGAAAILLHVIARHPRAVLQALKAWEFRNGSPYPVGVRAVTQSEGHRGRRPRSLLDD